MAEASHRKSAVEKAGDNGESDVKVVCEVRLARIEVLSEPYVEEAAPENSTSQRKGSAFVRVGRACPPESPSKDGAVSR